MIEWSGPRFDENGVSIANAGSWAGGAMVSPVDYPPAGGGSPLGGFSVTSSGGTNNNLHFASSALFLWADTITTEPRDAAFEVVITGLTPGDLFTWRSKVLFNSDTVPETGYFLMQSIGLTTASYRVARGPGLTLFTFDGFPPAIFARLATTVPPSGQVTIRVYAWFQPSYFVNVDFRDLEFGTLGTGNRRYRLLFTRPPSDARAYPRPLEEDSVRMFYPSGATDALVRETNHLAVTARWIPGVGTAAAVGGAPPQYWGWDQDGGWARFLADARAGGEFDVFPDQLDDATKYECVLVEDGGEQADVGGLLRQLRLTVQRTDGQPFPGY